MQIKIENLNEKCEIHVHAVVEGDEWKNAQQKALEDLAKNVTIKGFRKGKAPLAQSVKFVNPRDVMDKAADKAVNRAFNEMLQKGVNPIFQPELQVTEFKAEKLAFTFIVVKAPELTLGEYKGLTVEKAEVKVTKVDVDNELHQLALKNAELVVAEESYAAANGDTAVIDFTGFVDGEAFEGGKATSFELELGSNTFVPGFETQLVGIKTNEDRDVVIRFPENYVQDLSGKEATFKVHVNAIKKKIVPAIDDDLAKDLDIDGVDTLEQLEAHLRLQIKERKVKAADEGQITELVNKIIDSSTLSCHEKILREDAKKIVKDFELRIGQQGLEMEDYLNMSQKTLADLENEAVEEARKNTKRAYFFEQLAKQENLTVSNEEVEARLLDMSQRYNLPIEEVKKQIGNRLNALAYNMKQEKVVEFLKANNNL